eukprot:7382806-Lingulodinium_polyedra.AAC.1
MPRSKDLQELLGARPWLKDDLSEGGYGPSSVAGSSGSGGLEEGSEAPQDVQDLDSIWAVLEAKMQ